VSTKNAEAQRFFDQGLNLSFGFNHDEAFRAFQRASQLDPQLAMATWGMALVLGPNINLPIDEARSKQAYALIQKAVKQYVFVSTRSVYADTSRIPMTIEAPISAGMSRWSTRICRSVTPRTSSATRYRSRSSSFETS